MIAVTFALPRESSGFRRLLSGYDREIAILHTGVGGELCRKRIGPFLEAQRFDFVISSGFAGGVDPLLGVGDLLLANNFSDPKLLVQAQQAIISQVGKLVTIERVMESAAERAHFAREHGAAAVDMETKWIAQACAARNIRFLSLRVISDTAAAPLPLPAGVLFNLAAQKTEPLTLARYLARRPGAVVRLARFARQIAAVRANLTSALALLARELLSPEQTRDD
jgi:adenosylhomocysteine nucleosidase